MFVYWASKTATVTMENRDCTMQRQEDFYEFLLEPEFN